MIVVSTIDANDQRLDATLDDTLFYIVLSWNAEAQFWTISLQNAEGATLVSSVKIVPFYPLFFRFRYGFMPLGDFVVDLQENKTLGRNSFINGDARLIYMTQQDLIDNNLLDKYGRL